MLNVKSWLSTIYLHKYKAICNGLHYESITLNKYFLGFLSFLHTGFMEPNCGQWGDSCCSWFSCRTIPSPASPHWSIWLCFCTSDAASTSHRGPPLWRTASHRPPAYDSQGGRWSGCRNCKQSIINLYRGIQFSLTSFSIERLKRRASTMDTWGPLSCLLYHGCDILRDITQLQVNVVSLQKALTGYPQEIYLGPFAAPFMRVVIAIAIGTMFQYFLRLYLLRKVVSHSECSVK